MEKFKEYDIRPKEVWDEHLRLTKIDTETYFKGVACEHIKCPACGIVGEHEFHKSGFSYSLCIKCNTLYVSPRPKKVAFNKYYTESPSVEYWATTFYSTTAEARREKLWKPKAKLIYKVIENFAIDINVIDIGGGYGIFAEELELLTGNPVMVIEPSSHLATACRNRGICVVEKFLEDVQHSDLPVGKRVFVSFELFEHLHDPGLFLIRLLELMLPGDVFVFTTLSSLGVDIQGLWEDSESVSPPHHLNFFNPLSIKILLNRVGLECLEVKTPGVLDIDILSNNHHMIKDRFLKTFVTHATGDEKDKWQQVISESGWSSHMMVCCQKP